MIESRFWKEELLRIANELKRVKNPKKWSERLVCTMERDVMVGFFIVRRMTELRKISDELSRSEIKVLKVPRKESNINLLNYWDINKHYEFEDCKEEVKKVEYVANQFIHSKISYLFRDETRNWKEFVIASDYENKKVIWIIPVIEIIKLFKKMGTDFPNRMDWKYNKKNKDFDIFVSTVEGQ